MQEHLEKTLAFANDLHRCVKKLGNHDSVHNKNNKDSMGYFLETEIATVFTTGDTIVGRTKELTTDFIADGIYGNENYGTTDPPGIPDIINFQGVYAFAESADGSPFCLDFRFSQDQPRIIWWDDDHWRVISLTMQDFIDLFCT